MEITFLYVVQGLESSVNLAMPWLRYSVKLYIIVILVTILTGLMMQETVFGRCSKNSSSKTAGSAGRVQFG